MGVVEDSFVKKYGKFTDIQKMCIPIIHNGENCLISAPTGFGKTEAAFIPILDMIVENKMYSGISLIYVTPLRALNRDVNTRLSSICKEFNISIATRHSDTTISERQKQQIHAPCILITTPETLQSILVSPYFKEALKNTKYIIIDEVHEIYSSKRGTQLSLAIERLKLFSKELQIIGISATIGNIKIMGDFLFNDSAFKIAELKKKKNTYVKIEYPNKNISMQESIIKKFDLDILSASRLNCIIDHIKKSQSTIIFGNTRQIVEALGSKLTFINKIDYFGGIGVHHSSLNRIEKISVEEDFKSGKLKCVIATSSLELGIDIGRIDLVIQYGSPKQGTRLIQRIGRSGHIESGTSIGVIIATNIIEVMESHSILENIEHGIIETNSLYENALDVLMHQIIGILLQQHIELPAISIFNIIKNSFPYKNITIKKLSDLFSFMEAQSLIKNNNSLISISSRAKIYYYKNLSFISDSKKFIVKDIYTNKIISTLDERFVINSVQENSSFITRGLPWRVISIDDEIISVEPSGDFDGAIPDWSGEDIPVSNEVAIGVFDIFNRGIELQNKEMKNIIDGFIETQKKSFTPNPNYIFIEKLENYFVIYSALGSIGNEAFGKIISNYIVNRTGRSVGIRTSPYSILIESDRNIDLEQMIYSLGTKNIPDLLESALLNSDVFIHKFITIAKFFGVIDRGVKVSKQTSKQILKHFEASPIYTQTINELMDNYQKDNSIKMLEDIIRHKRIKSFDADNISIFGNVILNSAYYTKELIAPLTPNSLIMESFVNSTLMKKVELLCTYCNFRFTRKLDELKDCSDIKCPNCKSTMITRYNENYAAISKKRSLGSKLNKSEIKMLKEMTTEASLFDAYGGRTAVALATYGIGVHTAAKILMMYKRDYNSFFIDLLDAQKQFIRTKKYWS